MISKQKFENLKWILSQSLAIKLFMSVLRTIRGTRYEIKSTEEWQFTCKGVDFILTNWHLIPFHALT